MVEGIERDKSSGRGEGRIKEREPEKIISKILERKLKVCNFGVPKEWKGKTALSFGG